MSREHANAGREPALPTPESSANGLEPSLPELERRKRFETFLQAFREAETTQPMKRIVDDYVAAGRIDWVYEIACRLRTEAGELAKKHPGRAGLMDAVREHIQRRLCRTPGVETVEALLLLPAASERRYRPRCGDLRDLASELARHQPEAALREALARHADRAECLELSACLVQEMLLRGLNPHGIPAVDRLVAKLVRRRHRLAVLPLELFDAEMGFSGNPSSPRSASSAAEIGRPLSARSSGDPVRLSETTDPATADLMTSAVKGWLELSNGRAEARTFVADRPLNASDLTIPLLSSIGLASLKDAREIRAKTASAIRAMAMLFSAAAGGGAYDGGMRGACGRLQMWRSAAGLLGLREDTPVAVVAEAVRKATWVEFEADSMWFYRIAWDFGLAVLRPDGRSLAVLAATDTD